jgi:hypothetical protein
LYLLIEGTIKVVDQLFMKCSVDDQISDRLGVGAVVVVAADVAFIERVYKSSRSCHRTTILNKRPAADTPIQSASTPSCPCSTPRTPRNHPRYQTVFCRKGMPDQTMICRKRVRYQTAFRGKRAPDQTAFQHKCSRYQTAFRGHWILMDCRLANLPPRPSASRQPSPTWRPFRYQTGNRQVGTQRIGLSNMTGSKCRRVARNR